MRSLSGRNRPIPVLLILLVGCLTVLLTSGSRAQELSTYVFPSEDELLQALTAGEISYTQFVILSEIAYMGLDSDNAYLLDEIPNLDYFQTDSLRIPVALRTDQKRPFEKDPIKDYLKGSINYQYYQSLREEARGRYRIGVLLRPSRKWHTSFKVHGEYSGSERVASRSVAYTSRSGFLRKLILGNFTARLGKGSVIGYRGKLLEFSKQLDNESVMYPDYGGFNGLYATARTGPFELQGMGSYNRDSTYSALTVAGSASLRRGPFRPGLVLGINRLENRQNWHGFEDFKGAVGAEYNYKLGYSSLELTGQAGDGGGSAALVLEGRHRFEAAETRYAGWAYGDSFVDLSGGSKVGNLSRKIELEEVGFEFSSRRAGQEGLLFKTVVVPAESWAVTNSALLASLNADTTRVELLSSVSRDLSPSISIRGDYLVRRKKTVSTDGIRHDDYRRTRLEVRIKSSQLSVRSYIAYAENDIAEGYFSLFGSLRLTTTSAGSIEFWSNLGRWRKGVVEYWYLYLRHELDVSETVVMVTKLSNAYRRDGSHRNDPVLSLELRVHL